MKARSRRSAYASALLSMGVLFLGTTTQAQPDSTYEARLFGINTYGGVCGGSNLQYTDNNVNTIWNGLSSFGYANNGSNVALNANVRADYWVDISKNASYGRDQYWGGIDFVDVAMHSGHGSRYCNGPGDSWSAVWLGSTTTYPTAYDSNGNPYINYAVTVGAACGVNTRDHLRLGGAQGDGEILILDACLTTQKCVWEAGGYNATFGTGAKMLLGFHGISYDRNYQSRYSSFVNTSEVNGIGAHWVDDLTDLRVIADDQCATAVVFGASPAERDALYDNGGFKDIIDPGPHYGSTFYYWNNCDPDDGEKL